MKKIFLTILLLFACLNVVYSQNTMRIDTLSGKPGDTLTYSVKIDNVKSFVAYQLDVQIPAYLTYVNNSAVLTGRANGHNLGVSLINPALLRLIAYSISMNPFLGNTGAVLTFKCYVTGNVPGTYSLNVVTPVIADSLNANILTASYNGRFVLLMPKIAFSTSAMNFGTTLLGTNKDLSLTIYNQGTSNLTISKITSSSADIRFLDSSGFTLTAGTNVSRTVRLYANTRGVKNAVFVFYSNDPSDSVHTVTATGTVFTTNELYLNTVTSKYGFVGTMKIRMKNFESVSAFQTSITLPASINYVAGSVVLNPARTNDHIISASVLSGNILKIVSYSPTNKPYSSNDSTIAQFSYIAKGNPGSYSIPITEGIISDTNGVNILSNVYPGSIFVVSPVTVLPASILFDTISYTDTSRKVLTIQNTGNDTLLISGINATESSFANETALPVRIPPSSTRNFTIRFTNSVNGLHTGNLIVSHNDSLRNPGSVAVSGFIYKPTRLRVTSSDFNSRDTSYLPFNITNKLPIVAFQFDVTLPSQFAYVPNSAILTSRANGHLVSTSTLGNGDIRVIAYSMGQNRFYGDSGDVVKFRLAVNADTGVYNVTVKNVIISDSNNINISTGSDNGIIRLSPYPPALITPLNGSVGNPLSLSIVWSRSLFASYYHLQVATDSLFTNITVNDSTRTDTTYALSNLSILQSYYWRVRVKNYSGVYRFSSPWKFRTIGYPTQVVLSSPVNNETDQSLNPTFKWFKAIDQTLLVKSSELIVKNGEHRTTDNKQRTTDNKQRTTNNGQTDNGQLTSNYWFELATDSLFTNIITRDSTLSDTTKSVTGLSSITNYFWRVRAKNQIGWALYSAIWKFTTLPPLPQAPVLISPLNNSTGNPVSLNLSWSRPQYATGFDIVLATDAAFTNIVLNDSTLTDTLRTFANLNALTTYYWKVRAKNVTGWGSFSSTFNFKTVGTPTQVLLSLPSDGAINQPTSLMFKWFKAIDQTLLVKSSELIVKNGEHRKTDNKQRTTDNKQRTTNNGQTDNGQTDNGQLTSNYWFELATDAGFTSIVARDSSLTDTVKAVTGLSNTTTYFWRVKAKNQIGWSLFSSVWGFTTIVPVPGVPVLLSPVFGSTGNPLNLNLIWSKPSNTLNFHVILATDTGFTSIILNDSTLTDSVKAITNMNALTTYYWKVRAKSLSGWSEFSSPFNFKTVGTPTQVVLSVPANGSTGQPVTLTFNWFKAIDQMLLVKSSELIVKNGEHRTTNNKQRTTDNGQRTNGQTDNGKLTSNYWFEYGTDSMFATVIARDSSLTDTTKTISGLNNLTKYFWRVKAKNQIGWGLFSSTWNFTTIIAIPVAPALATPLNNATGVSLTPALTWNTVTGAVTYRVQVSTDSNFVTTQWDTTGVSGLTTTVPAGKLSQTTKYYWRVNATNAGGTGAWSVKWNFTTLSLYLTLNLKVYLEGFWDGAAQITDTVRVYLANSTTYALVDTAKVVLSGTGTAGMNFNRVTTGNYYIVVSHRNHLETWSKLPQSFVGGIPLNYDFTTAVTQSFGDNMKQVGSVWVLFGGDANADGSIDANDIGIFIGEFGNLGYLRSDFNGDQDVNASDVLIISNNFGLIKIIPGAEPLSPMTLKNKKAQLDYLQKGGSKK